MSLTNDDLKSIKGIVDTAIDTKIDNAIDTKVKRIVNDAVDGVEKRLNASITTEIRASEQRMTHATLNHGDARHEQLSVQMENGFTHLQNQFRKSIRP